MVHGPASGPTFTTFETGAGARCGALATLGASDALVVDRRRAAAPAGRRRACGDARVSRRALRDGLWALIVLGPRASGTTRREAGEIARALDVLLERVEARERAAADRDQRPPSCSEPTSSVANPNASTTSAKRAFAPASSPA